MESNVSVQTISVNQAPAQHDESDTNL